MQNTQYQPAFPSLKAHSICAMHRALAFCPGAKEASAGPFDPRPLFNLCRPMKTNGASSEEKLSTRFRALRRHTTPHVAAQGSRLRKRSNQCISRVKTNKTEKRASRTSDADPFFPGRHCQIAYNLITFDDASRGPSNPISPSDGLAKNSRQKQKKGAWIDKLGHFLRLDR